MSHPSYTQFVAAPARAPKPRKPLQLPREALGASVAAMVGLAWLLAPGFNTPRPAEAPSAPSPEPALAMPAAPLIKAPALHSSLPSVASARRGELELASQAAHTRPAWVTALAEQGWVWPRHLVRQGDGAPVIDRHLVGWYPMNAADKRMLYALTVNRVETRLYEGEIPAFEARVQAEYQAELDAKAAKAAALNRPVPGKVVWTPEMIESMKVHRQQSVQQMKAARGAVAARDVTDYSDPTKFGPGTAELTYADGHKELVAFDPLVFDLKGTGIKTANKKVLYDLYGYGQSDKTQWMNDLEEGTGVLVFDAQGTGSAGKNGSEVFGDRTDLDGVGRPDGFANGFEALHAFVAKAVRNGTLKPEVLDNGILDAAALVALEKAYGLKMKLGGMNRPPVSLAEAGVAAIALSSAPTQKTENFDGQANDLMVQPGAVFLRTDGTTGSYMNIWLKAKIGNLGLVAQKNLYR